MPAGSFFDPLFFATLVFVAALTFADLLLGKKGRDKTKELVGDWWLFLEDATYAGLGAADAHKIHAWFRARLGAVASVRFWVLACAGALVLTALGRSTFVVEPLSDRRVREQMRARRHWQGRTADGTLEVSRHVLLVPTTVREAMGLLAAITWKTASRQLQLR